MTDGRIDRKELSIVLQSLLSGSLSSALTTVIYQPLELLKTRIQLQSGSLTSQERLLGRTTKTATKLIRGHSFQYLWRGTGASLLRSVPGVGLYYASLKALQINLSDQHNRPNNATQAFYFALAARSMVSFILLPVTVVKVRYESGRYVYPKLSTALKNSYLKDGWVGAAPTILRDSLFSGVYYMCYIKLKSCSKENGTSHLRTFLNGVASGLIASVITNPIDVIKTKLQVDTGQSRSMGSLVCRILEDRRGYVRFFDGLVPRSVRRTLIAATTWTLYEYMTNFLR